MKEEIMSDQITIVREQIEAFCVEFVAKPYLCYTEHGLHALFFTRLYNALPEDGRYGDCDGETICLVQKEYPTATNLGRPKRQHWDVALIKDFKGRLESMPPAGPGSYDRLRLAAAVEFGLNEPLAHLRGDIARLSHDKANVDQGFAVHLYRLSEPGNLFSRRDWSASSGRVKTPQEIDDALPDNPVEVYYALPDRCCKDEHKPGVWRISGGKARIMEQETA
jgi:hypothetical protein